MNPSILKDLEGIINASIEDIALPYVKGNTIHIKHVTVKKTDTGWCVVNNKTKNYIAKYFCKSSAIALAKLIAEGRGGRAKVAELDKIIQKNYFDCLFYKHTLETCADPVKREVTHDRFDISVTKTKNARKSLDSIIFRR